MVDAVERSALPARSIDPARPAAAVTALGVVRSAPLVPRRPVTEDPLARWEAMAAGLPGVRVRPELEVDLAPGPARLAPHTAAVTADLVVDDEELATGRLVLLHDPAGHDAWQGDTRLVAYLKADLEADMAGDPLLAQVAWGWLLESLADCGAEHVEASGTITRVVSEGFGTMSERTSAQVELRASWTPVLDDPARLVDHSAAFGTLLCQAAGLPPLPPGVAVLGATR
ncbi:Protein of unknown function (DUF3000) [Motilibacter peucedani]|uniref:DUF3000 family protein n=1 Tax=Motilibacter peucedani TaxID=598650 RepID=A0A420XRY0_9ACTN|nr:DUF3000 domain-containing protein [Motilibacter peucedani]RKS77656.1 Protein of unknown function (DUF3000) [Motilibacter peucedani]